MKQQPYRVMALLLVVLFPLALMAGSASAQQPVNTAFTYQGQLKRDGGTFTGDCAFEFGLWNAETGDTGLLDTQALDNVTVSNGIFTVQLDFGADPNHFTGDARWLEVAVQCQGDANPTIMTPRILLTSSPYAIGLMPGSQVNGSIAGATGVLRAVNHAEGAAIVGMAVPSTGQTFGILGNAFSPGGTAVSGYAENGATAVRGLAIGEGYGVYGSSETNYGVRGDSDTNYGVYGRSETWVGVVGESAQYQGVLGIAHAPPHGGVVGFHDGGGIAVYGRSDGGIGVAGDSTSSIGVYGESDQNERMRGVSRSPGHGGVVGVNETSGPGVFGHSVGGGFAVVADGKLSITGGGDVAERFASADGQPIAPGSVVVVDEANPGQLKLSTTAYDPKVIGVVSGAGGVEPGLILHQEGILEGDLVVAIAGRVYCQAEADSAPIAPGDLLTTADRAGYCMKASDRDRAYGATIGKALTGLEAGVGQVLVLINLH